MSAPAIHTLSDSVCCPQQKVEHFVSRRFLEPICDGCLLEEAKNGEVSGPSFHETKAPRFAADQNTKVANRDTSHSHGHMKSRFDSSSLSPTSGRGSRSTSRVDSRTKQSRRRGMDIGRSFLRISSRWSSSEKRSMENFRDALKEAAKDKNESAFSKFVKKETASINNDMTNSRSLVSRLRNSISCINMQENPDFTDIAARQHPPFRQQHHVNNGYTKESRSAKYGSQHIKIRNTSGRKLSCMSSPVWLANSSSLIMAEDTDGVFMPNISWEEHLQHDLAQRSSRKKHARHKIRTQEGSYQQTGIHHLPADGQPSSSAQTRSASAGSSATAVSSLATMECLGDIIPSNEYDFEAVKVNQWYNSVESNSFTEPLPPPAIETLRSTTNLQHATNPSNFTTRSLKNPISLRQNPDQYITSDHGTSVVERPNNRGKPDLKSPVSIHSLSTKLVHALRLRTTN